MSLSSEASLGALRLQAQYRSDLQGNPSVTDAEWNTYISQSYKELYDLLVAAYGNDYYTATTYQFNTTNSNLYPLPDGTTTYLNTDNTPAQKFYKLLGVDLQYSSSPSGWISLRRFEFIERNKYNYPNTAVNYSGYSNLRYRIEGNNLMLVPVPQTGQAVRLWYIPAPTSLAYLVPATIAVSGTVASMSNTYGIVQGMNVYGTGIQDRTTVSSVASTSITLSSSATATNPSAILTIWDDSTSLDGIAGWEEYIIIDAAIKAQIKQENDIQPLLIQKAEITQRIQAMAEGRDAGQAHHVSDALSVNGWGGSYDGGWYGGFGDGSGW